MSAPANDPGITFELDDELVTAQPGETIWSAARRHGVLIPHLCHSDGLRPDGNCRACVVEIEGERTLAPSCCRTPAPGQKVRAQSPRARKSQDLVLELLLADLPERGHKWNDGPVVVGAPAPSPQSGQHGELSAWAARLGVRVRPALTALRRESPAPDLSHPAMAVNLDACIQCNRCQRACREAQGNDVIGLAFRGAHTQVVFDLADPMGASSCVACGECVQACPTGALMPKSLSGSQKVDRSVDSVCPFCGIGCQIAYKVRDEKIVAVDGRPGPANDGRLCVKGRFGFDYAHHPARLTKPLIRKAGVTKDPDHLHRDLHWSEVFREASWDEALDFAAGKLFALRDTYGKKALAGFGSAKGSNEEAYLFQKLVRTGFGSNNVDHCTRLCHASSVAALLEGVGSGAVSNPVRDVEHADFILVIGSNPTSNHPVGATWIKNAVRRGARLVLADPRRTDIARHAWRVLQFHADTDVALLNAMLHVIVTEGLIDEAFIRERVDEFEALKANVQGYSPEAMAPICGIAAETIREVARAYATAKASMILWGMGVSQHVHGTDNVRCLIALSSITGQIGRPGTGLHPLRGQNNVQGASDAGLIPMMYPDYQRVTDAAARERFAAAWGVPAAALDAQTGLTVVELIHAMLERQVRGMFIMGENPAMSDPDVNHARQALASLELLVVQDIFLTETACLADVVLPASAFAEKTGSFTNTDRAVQIGRAALALPGEARQDLWILTALAEQLGLDWSAYGAQPQDCTDAAAAVFDEMRHLMSSIAGITWPADERPDAEYPMVLITGRQLEHWHTGSMTRRSSVLDAIEPDAVALLHPQELARLGVAAGDRITLTSRRGEVELFARADAGMPPGAVFVAFCWAEAAINELTNPALDPVAKIPGFKYCAVRVAPATVPVA